MENNNYNEYEHEINTVYNMI